MLRLIIKILLFPISLLLSILTAFLTFLLGIGTTFLYFLMLMCIVAVIGSFMQKDISLGIGIRIFVKPIRNTDGWSSPYSVSSRDK